MAVQQVEAEEELIIRVGDEGGGNNNNNNNSNSNSNSKAPRLPRWTRQEILVLIQGKRVAEGRVRRGSGSGLEPKWATVSSYCKRHGVNRGAVQCRKRWSNLAGDLKKIKEWESLIKDEADSYWLMRSDLRRERKLPGFFDREVYDILDGRSGSGSKGEAEAEAEEDQPQPQAEAEAVFDSGRSAGADDGLFSDFDQSDMDMDMDTDIDMEKATRTRTRTPTATPAPAPAPAPAPPATPIMPIPAPTPISQKQCQPLTITAANAVLTHPGNNEKEPAANPEIGSTSQEGRKRRRFVAEDDAEEASMQDELMQVLERNGRILSSQLEAQNINLKLDREERKDHATGLVAVLNKLADALGRIADKL